jgi:hypothetical protein
MGANLLRTTAPKSAVAAFVPAPVSVTPEASLAKVMSMEPLSFGLNGQGSGTGLCPDHPRHQNEARDYYGRQLSFIHFVVIGGYPNHQSRHSKKLM